MALEQSNRTGLRPGLNVRVSDSALDFEYGPGTFGPKVEVRRLHAIRHSLRDPNCSGPDPVYAIAMDVGRMEDLPELQKRMLLFGVVAYAAGTLGQELVRSQGHVHAVAPHCGWSTPELFEVCEGRAILYGQESTNDDPGRCIAVEVSAGEQAVIPPGWAHCVINADPHARMVFGAWCDRQYGFVYDGVRAHGGLAWFPIYKNGQIEWVANGSYRKSQLVKRRARTYPELGVCGSSPIYRQFTEDPESVQWVSDPARYRSLWKTFEP